MQAATMIASLPSPPPGATSPCARRRAAAPRPCAGRGTGTTSGHLWITEERRLADVVLLAGEQHRIESDGRAVIAAERDAGVVLEWPGDRTARHGDRLRRRARGRASSRWGLACTRPHWSRGTHRARWAHPVDDRLPTGLARCHSRPARTPRSAAARLNARARRRPPCPSPRPPRPARDLPPLERGHRPAMATPRRAARARDARRRPGPAGHGDGPSWSEDRDDILAADAALVAALARGHPGPVHLVGHSWGAAVAMRAARTDPRATPA